MQTTSSKIGSILRWLVGLCLPALLLAGGSALALWAEYHTPYAAVHLGDYLLQHNDERRQHGSVWQGILANRQSRTVVDSLAQSDTLALTTTPPAVLQYQFASESRGSALYVLRAHRRPRPLQLEQISGKTVQSLARSLEIFRRGNALLSQIALPREGFEIHARIQFQLALEDGSLFPLLHSELRKIDVPLAWNFIKMSPQDRHYWHDQLLPFSASADLDSTALEQLQNTNPELVSTCRNLLSAWEDTLYHAEIAHLQEQWRSGAERTIRLVRDIDLFSGYLIAPNTIPTRFTIAAAAVSEILGLNLVVAPPSQL